MCMTKNGALKNSSINWIFLWRRFFQNHSKLSNTEKRRNKTKYLTWNCIRLKFVKNTSMPTRPCKRLGYIKCYNSSGPRPVKSPSNFIRYNFQKVCSISRRPKTILEIWKKTHFLIWSSSYYLQVFQRLVALSTYKAISML